MVAFNNVSSEKVNENMRKRKISIIESGFNCRRGLNVNAFGMPLTKKRKYIHYQERMMASFTLYGLYKIMIYILPNVYAR